MLAEREEYDLKKSEKTVGQLRPIIKDAYGRIVDGKHRKEANRYWREETWEDVKTEDDYWKARAHLNFSRRDAHEARLEKTEIVNSLAEHYIGQGLHVSGRKRGDGKPSAPVNEVLEAVIKALDGAISASWIRKNIDRKYLQTQEVVLTAEEVLSQYSPYRMRGEDEYLEYQLQDEAGVTASEAREAVQEWKHRLTRLSRGPKTRFEDPTSVMYGKLAQYYSYDVIDTVGQHVPAKTLETLAKYCRRYVARLHAGAEEEARQVALQEALKK